MCLYPPRPSVGSGGRFEQFLAREHSCPCCPPSPWSQVVLLQSSTAPIAGGLCSMPVTALAVQPAAHQGLSPRHNPEQAAWEGNWQPELPACTSQHPGSQGRR